MRVLAEGLAFPEGPAFAPDGLLWCVELKGEGLVHYTAHGVERIHTGGEPNGLTFDRTGAPVFCDAAAGAIRTLERALCDGFDRPNDLAFDARGNLLFTCPGSSRREPTGYVRCLAPSGEVTAVGDGLYFPNGLAFGPDGTTLYLAETYRRRLWKGSWDAVARCWRDAEPWVDVGGPVGPDGLAVDVDGNVYAAVYGQQCIRRFDPAGVALEPIPLPAPNPTNVAFDPAGELGLVVTEASQGLLLSFSEFGPGVPLFS